MLSLAMIPANGITTFASSKQGTTQTKSVKRSVKSTDAKESGITLDENSFVLKIGTFNTYHLQGIDPEEFFGIYFVGNYNEYLEIYTVTDDETDAPSYMIVPKKTGRVEVIPHIKKIEGDIIKDIPLDPVTLEVVSNDEDIAPITDNNLFNDIKEKLGVDRSTTFIKKEQMKDLKELNITGVDNIGGIEYATNCEELNISYSYNLDDISNLGYLTKLKKLTLNNTNVSNVSVLKDLPNLEYINLDDSKVSAEDRLSLIRSTKAEIQEGTEISDISQPAGLVSSVDTVTSSDPSVVSVKQYKDSDGMSKWYYKAGEGKAGQKATITIENEDYKKEIEVTVVENKGDIPSFKTSEYKSSVGCFGEVGINNLSKVKEVKLTSDDESVLKLNTAWRWSDEDQDSREIYVYEPQGKGEATVTGIFITEDGTKYRDEIKASIDEAADDIVPIKSYNAYSSLRENDESYITWEALKEKTYINLNSDNITNEDLDWISQAENCEDLNLPYNDNITDIKQLKNLKKLKKLNLAGTGISETDTLKTLKDQLDYLNIQDTQIEDKDRLDLISSEPVTVCEGGKTEKVIRPAGLFEETDTAEIADTEVAEADTEYNESDDKTLVISAKKGQAGKKTTLTITTESGATKTIDVNVIEKDKNAPGFAKETMDASIGRFSEISLKNMDNAKVVEDPESDNPDVVTIHAEERYNYETEEDEIHYYLEPKSKGTANITMSFKADGMTYSDTITVNVGTDDSIVPVTDYELYQAMICDWDDRDKTDCIKKTDTDKIKTIERRNGDFTNLSGVEYATECTWINLSNCRNLKDISQLSKLTKLKTVDLSYTGVSDISALENVKDQLTTLYLKGSKVSAADRLSFIKNDEKTTVEAGAQKEVTIKPAKILDKSDVCTIEGDDSIKVTNKGNGKINIDARESEGSKTCTLIITNKKAADQKVEIPVEIKKASAKAPGFAKEAEDLYIGNLSEVKYKNASSINQVTLSSKNKNIVNIAETYNGGEYHYEPKNEGTTQIEGTFKKSDGTIYKDTITVTVKKADGNQKLVPIKTVNTYDRLYEYNDIKDTDYKITEDDIKKIKKIYLDDTDAESIEDNLSGLDQAVNCEELTIENYDDLKYSDIETLLSKLTKINRLELYMLDISQDEFNHFTSDENKIENLQKFTMTQQTQKVKDFSALKNLKNLTSLELRRAEPANLDGINQLAKLESLELYDSTIKDISGLKELKNLKKLGLSYSENITDFSVLAQLKDLEYLSLRDTRFNDVSVLKGLDKLDALYLPDNDDISAEDRLSLIRTDKIVLEENERLFTNEYTSYERCQLIRPVGILRSSDEVVLDRDVDGITVYQEGTNVELYAKSGSAGTTANLLFKNNGVTYKTIPVSVVKENEQNPGFKSDQVTISIGDFSLIELKNAENLDYMNGDYTIYPAGDADYDIIRTIDVDDDNMLHYEPKTTGTAVLDAYFTGTNKKEYKTQQKVTVTEAPDNIVPIASYRIFTTLKDANGKSVDGSISGKKDYRIDTDEIKKAVKIEGHYSRISDSDLSYLKKAVNCESIDLSDNKGITDLSFVNDMPKLKEINLENDELITDFKPLIDHKSQFEKITLPANAPNSVRKELISTDSISLTVGQTETKAVKPAGLLKETDKVTVADSNIAEAKIVTPEGEDAADEEDILNSYIEIKAKNKGTTTLTIQMGSETKTININVTEQEPEKKVEFADASKTTKLGVFKQYEFANVKASDIESVKYNYSKDGILSMIQNADGTYTPQAKEEGTVKVSAEITLKNGEIKNVEETTFTVSAADKNAVVIKDYDLYKGMMSNGKSADTNLDGMISTEEIKNVDDIIVKNSETLSDLTGIDKAVNCKKVEFVNDAQLKDISLLANLTNLTSLTLRSTSVTNIDALKGLTKLTDVNLQDNSIKESDQLALLSLKDVSMTEGETKTQDITPKGILSADAKAEAADSSIADAQIKDGTLVITGKAVGTTKVSIYNSDKESARTITVTVEKKEEPQPPKPDEPTTEKPQQPTTEKPKPQVVKVTKITIQSPTTNVAPGKKIKLKATVTPAKAANKAVTWSTSNSKYATVDKNGTVAVNKKAGGKTVTITATAKDGSKKKASIKIKIAKGEVKKIKITGKKTVNAGKTLSLKAKVTATKGANKKLKWTSSNTKYATVSSSGKVKALKAGKKKSVKITAAATDGTGKKATITIKIK